MHLLILGYGSIVRRRVLPAARAVTAFDTLSIASRSQGARQPEAGVRWYSDYDQALGASRADIVYVSGVNSIHEEWIARSLERGCHVIADKPALPDFKTTEAAVARARRVGRGLAEATVFPFHPQVARIIDLIAGADRASLRATAVFSVPPLPAGDFRYRAEYGGGCLSDLGPYAVATSRLLFGGAPATADCRILTRTGAGVDTSFSVLMTYESGGSLAGHFGFVTAYQNRWSLLTASSVVEVDRIFTTAPDASQTVRVRGASGEELVTVPAADAFAEFLRGCACAIERQDFTAFESAMLADAALLERLRVAARA